MTAIENTFTLDVPSTTKNLALIREFVTRVAEQAGLNETEVGQLELAVDEACANVIEHAYGDDKTKQVMVRAIFDEDTLRIHVIDTGKGFDPTQRAGAGAEGPDRQAPHRRPGHAPHQDADGRGALRHRAGAEE